ncbi:Hypothetical predicted protein, partial [Mytilus galloprovincialis]
LSGMMYPLVQLVLVVLSAKIFVVSKQTPSVGLYNLAFRSSSNNETKSYNFLWTQSSQTVSFNVTNCHLFSVPTGGMLKAELSLTTRSKEKKFKAAACITLIRTNQTTCQRIFGVPGRRKQFVSQLILHEVFEVQKNDQLKVSIPRGKNYIYQVGEYIIYKNEEDC